jgi:hypothetical protein
VFKNAQGKFDGRIFIGLMMGLGTVSGGALKFWWSIGDSVPPFWLWAVPIGFLFIGISAWVQRWREQRGIRERLERSARMDALRGGAGRESPAGEP